MFILLLFYILICVLPRIVVYSYINYYTETPLALRLFAVMSIMSSLFLARK